MKKLLFNPFERFAGSISVLIGVFIIAATAVIAFLGQIHLDGVIDLHLGRELTLRNSFLEGLIDWLSMVLFMYLTGLIFSKSSIRFVDVLGTQAMARFPYLIACLFSTFLFNDKILRYMEHMSLGKNEQVEISAWEISSFILMIVIMIATLVWMVLLMYRAYSISCNLKGNKAIISFIACLILAEALSKILISYLLA